MGAEVNEFELMLSEHFSTPSVCVSSGTAALHLALQACGIGVGHEVLVPSITYVATYQAIKAVGAQPVSCDIDPSNLQICLEDAQRKLTKRTVAIMPVYYAGDASRDHAYQNFAKKHGIRNIIDAAHAFGSVGKLGVVGSVADITCFSFDGIKNITCGEGGAVLTNDKNVLSAITDARLLGVQGDSKNRISNQRSWEFDVSAQGWRYHMNNVAAAIGIAQFSRRSEFFQTKSELVRHYRQLIDISEYCTVFDLDYDNMVAHIMPVRIPGLLKREALRSKMLELGIETGVHYFPNHKLTFFQQRGFDRLVNCDTVFPEILSLPLHCDLSKEDITFLMATLNDLLKTGLYF